MHRTRGYAARPPAGGSRGVRRSSPTAQRGRSPPSPAIPLAVRVGTLFLPQVAAAGARQETDEEEVRLAELQPLLSPPAGVASRPSYLCDWAQAIPCTITGLVLLPCQSEGCEVSEYNLSLRKGLTEVSLLPFSAA